MGEYIAKCNEVVGISGETLIVPDHIDTSKEIVRCRDCRHSRKDGTLCMFFASWESIAGGDEYVEMPADVEPDGFCAWGERRGDAE